MFWTPAFGIKNMFFTPAPTNPPTKTLFVSFRAVRGQLE